MKLSQTISRPIPYSVMAILSIGVGKRESIPNCEVKQTNRKSAYYSLVKAASALAFRIRCFAPQLNSWLWFGFFNGPNPSGRTMVLESSKPLTEMITRNLCGGKERPANKADNLTAICESTV
jgi:hypothetical protein